MKIYDGVSSMKWFYSGEKTAEQMRDDPMFAGLFKEPCVLYDDGADNVFRWEPLRTLALNMCVPNVGSPESVLAACEEMIAGRAPGVFGAIESAKGAASAAGNAQNTADEAKEMASQAGKDPQLQALATLQISTMSFDKTPCDEVVKFVNYWPDWKPNTAYKHNVPLTYQGRKFRASKDLTSQAIYPPGTAESEYYEVTLAPDGIIVWYNVGGEYNMVYKGEKRHYPDAEGPVYEALENTSYSPDAYPQHWKKVGDEA